MQNPNEKNGFSYTYSAKEQAQIKKIREKYIKTDKDAASPESKMERLCRLDNRVTQRAQTVSLIFGVIGTLLLGFGMSLIMTELSAALGLSFTLAVLFGVLSGTLGIALAALAYPAYVAVTRREREKIAPEVIRLTDELMK